LRNEYNIINTKKAQYEELILFESKFTRVENLLT